MSFSVLILTSNEELNLADCLESVAWSDDTVVLDCGSTDGTLRLAEAFRVRSVHHEFVDFAEQRNWALRNVCFRNKWVFHLDADERFTPELAAECRAAIAEDRYSGFLVPSKMMLFGRWLKHAAAYPVYQTRLVKVGEVWFKQVGHGQREACAQRGLGTLSQPYLHYSFNTGFDRWFEKHNRYSAAEAVEAVTSAGDRGVPWADLVSGDAAARRRAVKELSFRLPCRPTLRFLYMYLFRRGFLDGYAGYVYCRLLAMYEYMTAVKAMETRRRARGLPM